MKKVFYILLISSIFSIFTFANFVNAEKKLQKDLIIKGKSVYNYMDNDDEDFEDNLVYVEADDNGNYIFNLKNDISVNVVPEIINKNYTLVFNQINKETYAYDLMENSTNSFEDKKLFFEIYFIDEFAKKVENYPAEINIDLPDNFEENSKVYSVSDEGNVTKLELKYKDKQIIFSLNENKYYAIISSNSSTNSSTEPEKNKFFDFLKTGDDSTIRFWVILSIVSLCVLVLIYLSHFKKRKKSSK